MLFLIRPFDSYFDPYVAVVMLDHQGRIVINLLAD